MTPEEIKALQDKLAASEKEALELKEFKLNAEKKMKEDAELAANALLDKNVESLVTEKLITPAQKPYVKELLAKEQELHKFSVGGKEVSLSRFNIVKKLFALNAAKDVNTEEKTIEGESIPQSDEANAAIEKYVAEHKCTYAQAYKAVFKGKLKSK